MSEDQAREELVDAYLEGRVSRRIFIRRLVATGVSVAAAVTYAGALSGEVAAAPTRPTATSLYEPPPLYPDNIIVKVNGSPACADRRRAVRVRLVVKPRSETTVESVSDPLMRLTNISRAPNAWVIHLKSTGSSIPAHNATVVVGTASGPLTFVVGIPAFTCA
jgi:hypothetical protein